MDKILAVDVYQHFFIGASVRNQYSRELLMLLIDYGISQNVEESSKLLKNLRQCCTIFASLVNNQEKSDEELQGLIEVDWTTRLCQMFHNLRLERRTQDLSPRLTDLLARFNAAHDFKVNNSKFRTPLLFYFLQYFFGNDKLLGVLKNYMEYKDGQLSRAREHGERGVPAEEALDNLSKQTKELAQKEKDRREREKQKRSAQIDLEALERQALAEKRSNMPGKPKFRTSSKIKNKTLIMECSFQGLIIFRMLQVQSSRSSPQGKVTGPILRGKTFGWRLMLLLLLSGRLCPSPRTSSCSKPQVHQVRGVRIQLGVGREE